MIVKFSIEPYQNKNTSFIGYQLVQNQPEFPLVIAGKDSYVVSAEVQSGVNFDINRGGHNLLIGKYSSLADKITFIIDIDHDYLSVSQGAISEFRDIKSIRKLKRKCQIIIQNDVWVGHGATIMGGVTIHNGSIIAAESVVTKDVPPYAIVGGNPARILKYRFNEVQIEKLLAISWWEWESKTIVKNKDYFLGNIDNFINAFYDKAIEEKNKINCTIEKTKPIYLFFPDFDDVYPTYERVLNEFCKTFSNDSTKQLLIFIRKDYKADKNFDTVMKILDTHSESNCDISIQVCSSSDEHSIFSIADFFVTTRSKETVQRTCYADEFGVKIISGVDAPIFQVNHL